MEMTMQARMHSIYPTLQPSRIRKLRIRGGATGGHP
jgi:hypothetical protein